MKRWILICDAGDARIFEQGSLVPDLTLVRELANPSAREREQELVTDEPGRLRKPVGKFSLAAMDPGTTAHELAMERFARELAQVLDKAAQQKGFDQLIIAAPAHLLGRLRQELSPHVTHRLRDSIAKDLVHVSAADLLGHLKEALS